MKGSVGVSTNIIIYTRGRKKKYTEPRHSNCKKCIHAVVNEAGVSNCTITGDIAVHKEYCRFYKTSRKEAPNVRKYKRKGRYKKRYK